MTRFGQREKQACCQQPKEGKKKEKDAPYSLPTLHVTTRQAKRDPLMQWSHFHDLRNVKKIETPPAVSLFYFSLLLPVTHTQDKSGIFFLSLGPVDSLQYGCDGHCRLRHNTAHCLPQPLPPLHTAALLLFAFYPSLPASP